MTNCAMTGRIDLSLSASAYQRLSRSSHDFKVNAAKCDVAIQRSGTAPVNSLNTRTWVSDAQPNSAICMPIERTLHIFMSENAASPIRDLCDNVTLTPCNQVLSRTNPLELFASKKARASSHLQVPPNKRRAPASRSAAREQWPSETVNSNCLRTYASCERAVDPSQRHILRPGLE